MRCNVDPRSQFQPTARELLEHHIESEPIRPEGAQKIRYAQGVGDYVSETTAARENDAIINREFHAHARNAQQDLASSREALDDHVERSQAQENTREIEHSAANDQVPSRDILEQYMQAKREVTVPEVDPHQHERAQGLER